MNMNKNSKIYVAGHNGMVGSAIVRKLTADGYVNIVTRTRAELNLLDQRSVHDFFMTEKPEYIFMAAAKVGGIVANNVYRADYIYENLMIETNIIHATFELFKQIHEKQQYGRSDSKTQPEIQLTPKLLFLGSSCIYPKFAPQPLTEESLLGGVLEETNEPYAIAKIAGIKMCESYRRQYGCNFISVMPTNLYGPNDNYDLQSSHVLPAILRKFHNAKVSGADNVEIWGDGSALREFMHVDDLADACVFLMNTYNEEQFVNIGVGTDLSIKDLALLVKDVVGFEGEIIFDTSKPNGTPRKLMDISKLRSLGFTAKIKLQEGITAVYKDVLDKKIFD